jgi:hypothetical protein
MNASACRSSKSAVALQICRVFNVAPLNHKAGKPTSSSMYMYVHYNTASIHPSVNLYKHIFYVYKNPLSLRKKMCE